ncbi:MAG TPA: acetyl-CoA carboxylase biotin carboxyl carrier protein [Pseudogracilibacillus sp.]|nr:acetyl-CoA carboxylase biotin carboxyl carrier protein [Pseudogracilibacillus sp.]
MLKVQELREIIRLVDQSSISEFSYEKDDSKIKITKQAAVVAEQPVTQKVVETPVVEEKKETVAVKEVPKKQATTEVVEDSDDSLIEIVSPMVGTFYRKPSPEDDPYVNEGSKVTDSTIVCIVEAMKLFNEIEAEVQGEIVEILVGDGELVEYGQPLFKVKTK